MLTNDGSMPAFLRTHGFVDHLIRVALERGVTPIDAYRMATLNPATYYGLDGDLGGIAPGRYADICVLDDLAEPRPSTVIARGKVIAAGGRLMGRVAEPPWRRVFRSPEARLTVRWRARPDDFELPRRARYPVIQLVSAVISRLQERPMEPGDLHAALLDRAGRWLDGFATTTSTDFNILALGRRPEAMARAVNRLLDLHGGIVLVDGERIVYELALPLGGIMTRGTVEEAARSEDELRRQLGERGYAHHEPLYSLFFLAADFLPTVRLSPRGVWDVKRSRVLLPSRRRR
jgi:adenine deaminase